MEHQSHGEDRLIAGFRLIRAYWHQAALLASAVALGLAGLPFAEKHYWYYAVAGMVLAGAGLVGQIAQRPSYARLVEERDRHKSHATRRSELLEEALETFMTRLSTEINTNRAHIRVSLYCHRDAHFVLLARISERLRWRAKGRPAYPDSQGVIGIAWDTGKATQFNLPEKANDRVEELVRKGFSRDEAKNLKMPSRSLVAMRLTEGQEHVGVLVIESINPLGVGTSTLDALTGSRMVPSLCTLMYSAKDHFPIMLKSVAAN